MGKRERPVFSEELNTGRNFLRNTAKRGKKFSPAFSKGGGVLGQRPNSTSAEVETPGRCKKRRRGQREPVPPGPGALRGTHAPGGVPRAGGFDLVPLGEKRCSAGRCFTSAFRRAVNENPNRQKADESTGPGKQSGGLFSRQAQAFACREPALSLARAVRYFFSPSPARGVGAGFSLPFRRRRAFAAQLEERQDQKDHQRRAAEQLDHRRPVGGDRNRQDAARRAHGAQRNAVVRPRAVMCNHHYNRRDDAPSKNPVHSTVPPLNPTICSVSAPIVARAGGFCQEKTEHSFGYFAFAWRVPRSLRESGGLRRSWRAFARFQGCGAEVPWRDARRARRQSFCAGVMR